VLHDRRVTHSNTLVLIWLQIGTIDMPVNLSVKNVPDDVAEKLRQRAKVNNRSLQGELLALLASAVSSPRKLTASEVLEIVRESGLRTPRSAAADIRATRDAR
jgi:antitoxin FitA